MARNISRNFTLFQSEFKKWQKLFGLMGYKVYFESMPLDGCFADITINQREMVATARLNSIPNKHTNIRQSAKHEALHLLTSNLENLGYERFTSKDEIIRASEELVRKLEELIK